MRVAQFVCWCALAASVVACGGITEVSNESTKPRRAGATAGAPGGGATGGIPDAAGGASGSGGTISGGGGGGTSGTGSGGMGGAPGSAGSGPTCQVAFCPSTPQGTPCCISDGQCGVDYGSGCVSAQDPCVIPPPAGAICDQIKSGDATCDACLQTKCCDAFDACSSSAACVAIIDCAKQHGCIGKLNSDFTACLLMNCNAYAAGYGLYQHALACGGTCCAGVCP